MAQFHYRVGALHCSVGIFFTQFIWETFSEMIAAIKIRENVNGEGQIANNLILTFTIWK